MTSRKKKQASATARKKKGATSGTPAPDATLAEAESPTAASPEAAPAEAAPAEAAPAEAAPADVAPDEATPATRDEAAPADVAPDEAAPDEAAPADAAPEEAESAPVAADGEASTRGADDAVPTPRGDGSAEEDDGEWPEAPPDSVVPPAPAGPEDGPDEIVSSIGAFRWPDDVDVTVNLTGGVPALYERDDLAEGRPHDVVIIDSRSDAATEDVAEVHLRGLVEALVFASDSPVRPAELARRAESTTKEIRRVLAGLRATYLGRGIQLDEVGGAWVFRTNPVYAPFVRELTGQKPVKLTRAQIETLSILAYRQPITRPEIDDIRGVDSGPVLKMLLERDLIKILGKKDEPGRPILYGTTPQFLEFFGIASLKDLPTLREFTELNDDSKRVVERELGEPYEETPASEAPAPGEAPETAGEDLGEPETAPASSPTDELVGDTRVDEALAELERAALAADADPEESELGDALGGVADSALGDDDDAGDGDAPLDDGFDLGDEPAPDDDTSTGDDDADDDDAPA